MIIFNESADQSSELNTELENITILLTESEATQMIGYLEYLISEADKKAHYHLNNDDYSKEITLALYDRDGDLEHFAQKYREAILRDSQ